MERDRSNWSRSIRHQESFEPQPGNFDGMDRALRIQNIDGTLTPTADMTKIE